VVQVGTNDGEKLLACFVESRDGFLDAMSRLSYAQKISTGWYSGGFNLAYSESNKITKNGRTLICQQYTVQHNCILTVAMAANSISERGGSYVRINGVEVG